MANVVGRPIAALVLSADERAYLKRQVRGRRVARSLSERCPAILRCADGIPSKSVTNELGIHEHTVGKWRRRFLKDRIEGLLDEARPGRPRTIDDDQIAAVIERTLRSTPAGPPSPDLLMGPVVLGKLYPDVTMMQSAEDRQRQNATYGLDRPR